MPSARQHAAFVAENQLQLTAVGVPPENTFGLVGDVVMAPGGHSFVLDILNREVGLFEESGRRVRVLGRRGVGPGEFIGPVALALDDTRGGLYVLDERRLGIEVFDGERHQWQRTIPLDFHAADLCFVSGRLYVLGGRAGHLLHEVSSNNGQVLRSFAPDAASEDLLLRKYRGIGYLGCAPSGEIAFLPTLRPEVLRFSAERGQLLSATPIPGYRAVRVRPTADGRGMQFDVPGGGDHDYGGSIIPLTGGDWLVQVGRLKPGTNSHHEFESVRTLRLSASNGQIRPLPLRFARVMAAGKDVAFTVETSPYPSVRIIPTSLEELAR